MKITAYQSSQATDNKRWLAHMDLGADIYMSFFAATEQAAIDRAKNWYEAEKVRQDKIAGKSEIEPVEYVVATFVEHNRTGRGAGFAGKIWLLNRATGHRIRADAGDVPGLEAQGYVRGGPRSS